MKCCPPLARLTLNKICVLGSIHHLGKERKKHIWMFSECSHESVCCVHRRLPYPRALLITQSYVLPVLPYSSLQPLLGLRHDISRLSHSGFRFITGFSTLALLGSSPTLWEVYQLPRLRPGPTCPFVSLDPVPKV